MRVNEGGTAADKSALCRRAGFYFTPATCDERSGYMSNRPQCEAHDPTRQCASTPDEVARYFDANAAGEWGRMDRNPYMQLIWSLHMGLHS